LISRKIVRGLGGLIAGYKDLSKAYADKESDEVAAGIEAQHAIRVTRAGRNRFIAGVKLLS
jgi:hypothetical protein